MRIDKLTHKAQEGLMQAQQLAALQAIERLTQIREKLQEAHGMFPGDPLAEVRAEWEGDIERIWRGEA